jgi:hypothetical protein
MWRRRFGGGWGSRAAVGRGGFGLSYGTAVLLVSAAILLFLYFTGRLSL